LNAPRKIGRRKRIVRRIILALLLAMVSFTVWIYEPEPDSDAPRVLVSVDRTLWNRARLNRLTYIRALRKAGIKPVLIDFDNLPLDFDPEESLKNFDGLLISGGGDVGAIHYGGNERISRQVNPARDNLELALLAAADRQDMPMLGLCRGAQLLNVHRGGTLGDFREDSVRYQRHKRLWGGHPVDIVQDSRLAEIYGELHLPSIFTWHGQYVEQPGEAVKITAYAPDGTPEAIEVESDDSFGMIGVQWHAEVLPWDDRQARLFDAFYKATAHYQAERLRQ